MIDALGASVLDVPVPAAVTELARRLAAIGDTAAVLFYGSNLRTGALDGVLDFYVLTHGAAERGLWPTVSYHEVDIAGRTLRAKIATMRLATFAAAAADRSIDTTIWARFVQPAALVWSTPAGATAIVDAIAAAAVTAARYAAVLGPEAGTAGDYWTALFRATYRAELRVEAPGRERSILAVAPGHYEALLPTAWHAAGIAVALDGPLLQPRLGSDERRQLLARWRRHRRWGRLLNVARLVRAAFTFDGAARYAAWKIERHTGVTVRLTPWRERHPVLAAPGILWQVWRTRAG